MGPAEPAGAHAWPTLSRVVATLEAAPKRELPGIVAGWLDALDATGRWALLKLVRGEPKELHRLRRPDGTLSELLRWEWAEFDAPRRRLVWAEQGTIRCAPVEPEGVGAVRELFDARPLSFEPLAAPYSDETVFLKP